MSVNIAPEMNNAEMKRGFSENSKSSDTTQFSGRQESDDDTLPSECDGIFVDFY